MKKIIVLLFLLVPLCTKAQFDSNQAAFNWGRSLMLVVQGRQKLASQDYDGALETFREAFFDLDNKDAGFYLGAMVELGMGVETDHSLVDDIYGKAAEMGSYDARAALKRISRQGYWGATKENRKAFCQQVAPKLQTDAMMSGGGTWGFGSGSSSSSSSSTCSGCGGTGRCTTCQEPDLIGSKQEPILVRIHVKRQLVPYVGEQVNVVCVMEKEDCDLNYCIYEKE